MTGDISKRIRQNIQRRLKSRGEESDAGLSVAIYAACDAVQNRIAEESFCLQGESEISISSGQETYPFPDSFVSERKLVSDGGMPLVKISMDEDDTLTRARQSSDATSNDDVLYYYKWNGNFGFLGANGSIPGKSATVKLYYWRGIDDTEGMSDKIDPVVDKRWNKAIEYGALADLTGEVNWKNMFEIEFERVRKKEASGRSENLKIDYNGDYD